MAVVYQVQAMSKKIGPSIIRHTAVTICKNVQFFYPRCIYLPICRPASNLYRKEYV